MKGTCLAKKQICEMFSAGDMTMVQHANREQEEDRCSKENKTVKPGIPKVSALSTEQSEKNALWMH